MKKIIREFKEWWEESQWQSSPERLELARARLAAHRRSVRTAYPSPYVDPMKYNSSWQPILELTQR